MGSKMSVSTSPLPWTRPRGLTGHCVVPDVLSGGWEVDEGKKEDKSSSVHRRRRTRPYLSTLRSQDSDDNCTDRLSWGRFTRYRSTLEPREFRHFPSPSSTREFVRIRIPSLLPPFLHGVLRTGTRPSLGSMDLTTERSLFIRISSTDINSVCGRSVLPGTDQSSGIVPINHP